MLTDSRNDTEMDKIHFAKLKMTRFSAGPFRKPVASERGADSLTLDDESVSEESIGSSEELKIVHGVDDYVLVLFSEFVFHVAKIGRAK